MADPWAVVSVTPAGDDGWGVVSVLPADYPAVTSRKRTLRERFDDNAEDAFRRGTLTGAGADAAATSVERDWARRNLPAGSELAAGAGNAEDAEAFRRRSEADPFYRAGNALDVVAAGAATLGGQLVGALASPESWVGVGKSLPARMASNAAVAGATDPAVQGLSIEAGAQEQYDPWRTAASAGVGAAIPAAAEGVAASGRAAGRAGRQAAKRVGNALVPDENLDVIARPGGVTPDDWQVVDVRPAAEPQARAPQTPAGVDGGWTVADVAPATKTPSGASPAAMAALSEADARTVASEILPGATVTSGRRTAERNAAVGGAKNSWHLSGEALDLVPPKGKTIAEFRAELERRGLPVTELLDEGDHWHWAWGGDQRSAATAAPAEAAGPIVMPDQPLSDRGDNPGFTVDLADARPTPAAEPVADVWKPAEAAPAVMRPAFEEPAPAFSGAPKPGRTTMEPTHLGPMDRFADRLYRETSLDDLELYLPNGQAADRVKMAGDIYMADTPDLALGQGGNVGVVLEFDAAGLQGKLDTTKPTAGLGFQQGSGSEYVARYNDGGRFKNALRAVRIKTDAQTGSFGANVRVPRLLAGLEQAGWTRTEGKGFIQYERPRAEAAPLAPASSRVADQDMYGADSQAMPEPSRALPAPTLGEPAAAGWDVVSTAPADGKLAAMAAGNSAGLREAPRPGAVPVGADASPYAGQTVSQLASRVRTTLGITHRQGRVTSRKALGEYDPKTAVVRTKAVQELDVLAHEATHALEFQKSPALTGALQAHAAELEPLAYPGAAQGVRREEGFAEFGRWYLTNPDHARRVAPRFYEAFEEALRADNPKAADELRAIQAEYQRFLAAPSLKSAAASVAFTGNPGPIGQVRQALRERGIGGALQDIADDAYTAFIDDLHPVAKAVRKLQEIYAKNHGGQRLDLNVAKNPYALARLSREAYAAGHIDLMDGVVPYHGTDPEGPSLSQALETALGERTTGKWREQALREFDAYLIARRMVHEYDRYKAGELEIPPDRYSREFHEAVIRDAEAANPTWNEAASQVYGWLNNLWEKEFKAGLISEESYRNGLDKHPDYVPLMRDMSDKTQTTSGRPRGAMQYAGGV